MKKSNQELVQKALKKGGKYQEEMMAMMRVLPQLTERYGMTTWSVVSQTKQQDVYFVRLAYASACYNHASELSKNDIAGLINRDHSLLQYYVKDEAGIHHTEVVHNMRYRNIFKTAKEILSQEEFKDDLPVTIEGCHKEAYEQIITHYFAEKVRNEITNGVEKLKNFYKMEYRREDNALRNVKTDFSFIIEG